MSQVQIALGLTHRAIDIFENSDVEILFGAKIVVQHALVRARLLRDRVDARASEALLGELDLRCIQNALLGALCVAQRFDGPAEAGAASKATPAATLANNIPTTSSRPRR